MMSELICPVDTIMVNESKVRITAAFVFLSMVVWFIIPNWIIPAFLTLDFTLRSVNQSKYSPLGWASAAVIKTFSVNGKAVNAAPKRFAARIGTLFTSVLLLLPLFSYGTGALIIACVLVLFSFFESAAGFCAGCYVYTFYQKFFMKRIQTVRSINE